jgi:AraC-binding-like domain
MNPALPPQPTAASKVRHTNSLPVHCESAADLLIAGCRPLPVTFSRQGVMCRTRRGRLIGGCPRHCGFFRYKRMVDCDRPRRVRLSVLPRAAHPLVERPAVVVPHPAGGRHRPDSRCRTILVAELIVGSDMEIHCGELCSAYRVNVPRSGRVELVHRGSSLALGPGAAAVYQPEGDAGGRWAGGTRLLGVRIDRCAIEDALSDALGRQLMSQIDFTSSMSVGAGAARSWINMLFVFAEQLFRPDGLLNKPLAGLPFVDSLVRGLLLAADNSLPQRHHWPQNFTVARVLP